MIMGTKVVKSAAITKESVKKISNMSKWAAI